MARVDTLGNFLTDVADAIREKKGTSETIQASDFDTEIANLPSGGGLDWSAIGYSDTPQSIVDGYNYAKYIQDNWIDGTSRLTDDFKEVIICPLVSLGNRTSLNYFAYGCKTLLEIPLLNTSNVTSMNNMFNGCSALTTIPLLNTSSIIDMSSMFSNCTALTTIPLLNTSNVTTISSMFNNCIALTDTSLDNILQMCINATSYTGTKTLLALGFRSSYYPVSRIETLPHYQDFINAGWTIGY